MRVCVSDHQQMPKAVFPMELQHNTQGQLLEFSGKEVYNSPDGTQTLPNLSIKAEKDSKREMKDIHPSSSGTRSE